MLKCEIITLNSSFTICNHAAAVALNNDLCYNREVWVKKKFGKKKVVQTVRMIEAHQQDVHCFPTGLIDRALRILDHRNIEYEYEDKTRGVEFDDPYLKGITFMRHQREAIENAVDIGRGVIHHATGTGKSITMAGLLSCFTQENILVLVHSTDLVKQLFDDFTIFFGKDVGIWMGGKANKKWGRIVIATDKSFVKIKDEYEEHFDVVCVDECHHANDVDSLYGKILTTIKSPLKYGFTATLPEDEGKKMAVEALLGSVIHSYSIQDANKDGVLAKPVIDFLKIPRMPINQLMDEDELWVDPEKRPSKYRIVYWNGVVKNVVRNMMILKEAEREVQEGYSVLITFVNREHGHELMDMAKNFNLNPKLVYGKTDRDVRDKIKKAFIEKDIMCVIASVVWNEGINVKSLDTCIFAGGGKGEVAVLQKIGRGLRKMKNKKMVRIVDCDDSSIHTMLENQYNRRKEIYIDQGWL